MEQLSGGGASVTRLTSSFSTTIEATMERFDGGGSNRKLQKVKSQIDDVKDVMASNIDKVLERGEKLEDVLEKSDQMKDHAMQFKTKGKKLRRMLYCQNIKMKVRAPARVHMQNADVTRARPPGR